MVRSLYTSADMKKDISIPFDKDISITSDAVDRFLQSKCYFWVVFKGKSNSEVTDISVTSDPMDGIQSVRGHYGVVFQEQSNSEVTVQIR